MIDYLKVTAAVLKVDYLKELLYDSINRPIDRAVRVVYTIILLYNNGSVACVWRHPIYFLDLLSTPERWQTRDHRPRPDVSIVILILIVHPLGIHRAFGTPAIPSFVDFYRILPTQLTRSVNNVFLWAAD